jgi:bacillithiol system protein YtxJ
MNWISIEQTEHLEQIINESFKNPVMIFKHSIRCSISAASLDRLERKWDNNEMSAVKTYFLDIIRYRELSNKIAEEFDVIHQSPQVILIKDGRSSYDESHFGIDYDEIKERTLLSSIKN